MEATTIWHISREKRRFKAFGRTYHRSRILAMWHIHRCNFGKKKGEDGYILTSSWTMNKAFGVVHREHWQVGADGLAKLASDDFEVQGER